MTTMEILMLVGGLSAFVISFFLPDKNAADAGEGISQEELQQLFDDEVELSRQKIDDMTKETLDYSVERTERSLEKIANEKIMAVGEYSDTVLDQINQSHNQVVFLSDMLRKSKDELTELLNRADQTSKDANVRANEAYDLADHAMKLAEDAADRAEEAGRTAVSAEEKMIDARRLMHKVSPPPASADGSQGTDCQEDIDVVDIPEDLEVPGEIFEDLVNEFSLDDASEELADGGPRRGAEERLAESLSAFRESLRENEGGDYVESLSSYEGSDAEAEAESGEASEAEAGAEAGEADPFQVSDLLKSVSEEERFFRVSDHLDRDSEEPDLTSDIKESTDDGFAAFDDLFRNGTKEEGTDTYADEQPEMSIPVEKTDEDFAGMTEEEKMEALLRAATEELAQDVSAVTGISEMHWEPSETEEEEAASEDITCESTGNSDEDAERAAKARALEALKDEAESEYRETKAKALEALKAEAELAAVQPAADEDAAEFAADIGQTAHPCYHRP